MPLGNWTGLDQHHHGTLRSFWVILVTWSSWQLPLNYLDWILPDFHQMWLPLDWDRASPETLYITMISIKSALTHFEHSSAEVRFFDPTGQTGIELGKICRQLGNHVVRLRYSNGIIREWRQGHWCCSSGSGRHTYPGHLDLHTTNPNHQFSIAWLEGDFCWGFEGSHPWDWYIHR